MKKQLLLFAGLCLATLTFQAQTFTWLEAENCTLLSGTNLSGTYTPTIGNPNPSGINTNTNVSRVTKGTVRIALNNPIIDTSGKSLSLELLSAIAGGANVGSGRFQVQLQSLNPVTTTFVANLFVTADNTWELKTMSLDGLANATNGYEYIYINAGVGSQAGSDGSFYVDKIKGSFSQENPPITGTPSLLTNNAWVYDYGTSNLNATPTFNTSGTNPGTIDLNASNPDTGGNDSAAIMKVVRGDNTNESVKFQLTGSINQPYIGKINLRVYSENTVCSDIKNIRFSLLSTAATDTNGTQGQKVGPAAISIPPNEWVEVEVDLANFSAGQQSTEFASYDVLNVFMNFGDSSTSSGGSVFYFDALQTPASAVLSVDNVTPNSTLKLYPNPVENTFVLSKEVESARIYGVLGNLIQTIDNKQAKFDVSKLTKGVYFIEASVNNAKETIRFVKK